MDDRTRALLAERKRRRDAEAQRVRIAEVCAELRSFYYPKQAAFFASKARRRATRKTRRAGATTGGCRELLARALEQPGFRATYVATTRIEAKDRAWEGDTQNALADIVRQRGTPIQGGDVETYDIAGVKVELRQADLTLAFDNGSEVELFGADNLRAINKKRGGAKHVYWIDEGQDFLHLEAFYRSVVVPALDDFQGECWVSGTPGRDLVGMFYELTRHDGVPTLAGWEVHEFAQVDNPFFGATTEEREARTAQAALVENGWSPDDPDFQREYRGRWVKSDANYVYAAHAVPEHQLCFAEPRVAVDGRPDFAAALLDLPGALDPKPRPYFLAMGVDLGTRDDFAYVVWAWSLHDPTLYELASWKRPGLFYDDMFAEIRAVRDQVVIGYIAADAGGGGSSAVKGWAKQFVTRYNQPLLEVQKAPGYKELAIKLLNGDIRTGKLRIRKGGALHSEWIVHRWAKQRSATGLMIEDDSTPNHASDAGLYGHMQAYHHRGVTPLDESGLTPEEKRASWLQRAEEQLEDSSTDEGSGWRW
jgi:hypothetical protein